MGGIQEVVVLRGNDGRGNAQHGRGVFFASRYVGGVYVHRDHKGDKDGKPPFVIVEAEKQREALKLLEEQMFGDKPFSFPPELYNHLYSSSVTMPSLPLRRPTASRRP